MNIFLNKLGVANMTKDCNDRFIYIQTLVQVKANLILAVMIFHSSISPADNKYEIKTKILAKVKEAEP